MLGQWQWDVCPQNSAAASTPQQAHHPGAGHRAGVGRAVWGVLRPRGKVSPLVSTLYFPLIINNILIQNKILYICVRARVCFCACMCACTCVCVVPDCFEWCVCVCTDSTCPMESRWWAWTRSCPMLTMWLCANMTCSSGHTTKRSPFPTCARHHAWKESLCMYNFHHSITYYHSFLKHFTVYVHWCLQSMSTAMARQCLQSVSSVMARQCLQSVSSVMARQCLQSVSSVMARQCLQSVSSVMARQCLQSVSSVMARQCLQSML